MPWSLKALDEKAPCRLASLSGELLEAIVRAAVLKNDVIDLGEMKQEVDNLTKPFGGLPLLLEIAKREVMRVNTFRLPERFTDDSIDPSRRLEQDEEERRREIELWFDQTREMLRNGRDVEHLDISPVNDLKGGYFDIDKRRLEIKSPPLGMWARGYFGFLHLRFPKLKSLNIIVKTCQSKKEEDNFWHIINDDALINNSTEAEYKTLLGSLFKNDIFIRMQEFLAFAGSFHLPGLRKKTVMFVQ